MISVRSLLLLYGLSLFALPFLLQWVFQGHDLMWPVALMQVIRQGVYAVILVGFVRRPDQFWLAAVAETMGAVATAAVGIYLYRRLIRRTASHPLRPVLAQRRWADRAATRAVPRIGFRFSRELLTEGIPIGLSQMFWTARMFGATAIVGFTTSLAISLAPGLHASADLGYFGAAMRLLIAAHTFIWLYYFNLLPSLSRNWLRADGSFGALIARSTRLVGWLGLAAAIVWLIIGPQVIALVYGAEYAPAAGAFRWMALVWLLALLSGHYRFGLIAAGQQRAEMVSSALGAAAAVVAIPAGYWFGGVTGAAVGLVVAEAIVWLASRRFAVTRLVTSKPPATSDTTDELEGGLPATPAYER